MLNIKKYSVRLVEEKEVNYDIIDVSINSPASVANIAEHIFKLKESTQEQFCILTLDTKNKINGAFMVTQGILNASVVHAREVYQRAILNNAFGVILVHNHPSGDTTPSQEDKKITHRLVDAGELLGIKVIDHIIVGDDYFSFKEKRLI